MARKPRITAVPVDQPEGLMVANDLPEEKTDAEQMTEILQEVKEEPKVAVSDAVVEVKPKAKRASRAKPKEEPLEAEPKIEEPKEELKEEAKIDDKVACPDCGKQMSAKTLKYSHVANCVTKKPKTKTEKTDEQQYTPQVGEITEELIEHHIRTRSRAARALRRETMMNNLVQSAF
jgi:phage terminase small subunit